MKEPVIYVVPRRHTINLKLLGNDDCKSLPQNPRDASHVADVPSSVCFEAVDREAPLPGNAPSGCTSQKRPAVLGTGVQQRRRRRDSGGWGERTLSVACIEDAAGPAAAAAAATRPAEAAGGRDLASSRTGGLLARRGSPTMACETALEGTLDQGLALSLFYLFIVVTYIFIRSYTRERADSRLTL